MKKTITVHVRNEEQDCDAKCKYFKTKTPRGAVCKIGWYPLPLKNSPAGGFRRGGICSALETGGV